MKRESKFAKKTVAKGPPLPKFGHQIGKLNMPENAPQGSWWLQANGRFYDEAKRQLPRILQSKMHHQIQAVRIVGMYGTE